MMVSIHAGVRSASLQARTLALGALLALWLPITVFAEGPRAGVVTTLDGRADLARAEQVRSLRFNDDVFGRDRIDTAERSLVRVLLGGKAIVTVRELSSLTIGEVPDRAVVDLSQGRVALGVAKKLLRPGEAIEVRTPNAIAAVRGSSIVVTVSRTEGGVETNVVTRGVSLPVEVSSPGRRGSVELGENEIVIVTGAGANARISTPRGLTAQEVAAADAASHAPRAAKHDEDAAEGLPTDLAEETEKASQELVSLGEIEVEKGGPSTASIGLNEHNAALAARQNGAPGQGTPGGPGSFGSGGELPGTGASGGGIGGGGAGGEGTGNFPGHSAFSNGNPTNNNASPTGLNPPAHGLGGNPPPGHQ